MIVLSDNDIIYKLAHCDLLENFPLFLNVQPAQIYILPTCIFKLRRLLKNDAIVLARVEKFCQMLTTLSDGNIDAELATELADTGADAGELLLAQKVVVTPGAYLVTGDKRALKSFTKLPDGRGRLGLTGKVICFEVLLLGFIEIFGFERLRPNFEMGAKCGDKTMGTAFGPGRDEAHAVACLNSNLSELQGACSWILFEKLKAAA